MYLIFTNKIGVPKKQACQLLRVMKLSTLFLLVTIMHVSASSLAQQISLDKKNASLESILRDIRRQSGYDFYLDQSAVGEAKPITVQLKHASLQAALQAIFNDQPLTFSIEDKTIVVKEKQITLIDKLKQALAAIDISGQVTDEHGQPLAGASVRLKDNSRSTSTDREGKFTLRDIAPDALVIITFIGYETTEIKAAEVARRSPISLRVTSTNLQEVVVNKGYYATSSALNTGSVTHVGSDAIAAQPVTNPLAALEGRVPGMLIQQQTGMSGGGYAVQLRGLNSIANGNMPLFIVDGVPVPFQLHLSYGSSILGNGSPLNYLNTSDIESIDVLKDADATAIYGSRGANGVVLITTKKGKAGETRVSFQTSQGVGSVSRKFDVLNTAQYLQMRREAFKNDGTTPGPTDFDVNGSWDTTRNTNFQKVLIGNSARYQDYQGSISGGSDRTQVLIGGTLHRESTVYPGDFADTKGDVHFNIHTASQNRKFNAQLTGSYQVDNNNVMNYDQTSRIFGLAPDAPVLYNADGSLNWENGNFDNPLANFLARYYLRTRNLSANSVLSYNLLAGLTLKTSLGYQSLDQNENNTLPTTYFNPAYGVANGFASFSTTSSTTWIAEPQIDYERPVGGGQLSAVIGTTFQRVQEQGTAFDASGYTNDALLTSIQGAATITKGPLTSTDYRYNAIYGRLGYIWKDRYILNLTGRRDGSSRFGPGKQFGNFGAVGAAWLFGNEAFVKQALPFLSFGKLRASYGTSGNDQIRDYQFLPLFNFTGGVPYQGAAGLYPANLYNPGFAWETFRKLEAGLELGFLEQRLQLSLSYFRNRSSNQLVGYSLPDITGFTSVVANLPATVQNTGLEIVLNTINIKTSNWNWSTSLNLTIPRNKLVDFPGLANTPYVYQYQVGQPLGIARVFHSTGVDPATGIYMYTDKNGQPTANPVYTIDNTTIVNTSPRFYGGLQNNVRYKNFELGFLFQFVRQTGYNALFSTARVPGIANANVLTALYNDHWQKQGDHATYQQFTQSFSSPAYNAWQSAFSSDLAYTDASYIRLKNVSFSYTFGGPWLEKVKLHQLKLFAQAQNLLTFSHYLGGDPEVQSLNALPTLRVITAGIQFTL